LKDGTIFLVAYRPTTFIYNIVGKVIKFITKSNFTHSGIYMNGKYYDDTLSIDKTGIHSGVRVSDTWDYPEDAVLEYTQTLAPDQIKLMEAFLIFYSRKRIPYSILKLVSLAIVYPTRFFWNWIGWVPFENSLREVCSTAVDDCYQFAGIDLLPDQRPELVAPGDFQSSKLLKRIA